MYRQVNDSDINKEVLAHFYDGWKKVTLEHIMSKKCKHGSKYVVWVNGASCLTSEVKVEVVIPKDWLPNNYRILKDDEKIKPGNLIIDAKDFNNPFDIDIYYKVTNGGFFSKLTVNELRALKGNEQSFVATKKEINDYVNENILVQTDNGWEDAKLMFVSEEKDEDGNCVHVLYNGSYHVEHPDNVKFKE